jgi:hypothetical protein
VSELTTEQQAIFDAEIEILRERLERRRAMMALPSLKQRADALKSLWVAIEAFAELRRRNLCGSLDCSPLKRRTGSMRRKLSLTNCENRRSSLATPFWREA